jgi:hypothetical protein
MNVISFKTTGNYRYSNFPRENNVTHKNAYFTQSAHDVEPKTVWIKPQYSIHKIIELPSCN